MGFLISPALVKKRETSLPLSAIRAILSAEAGFFLRPVFFIEFPLRRGCFPYATVLLIALTASRMKQDSLSSWTNLVTAENADRKRLFTSVLVQFLARIQMIWV